MTGITPRGPFETVEEAFVAAEPLRAACAAVHASDQAADRIRQRRIGARDAYITDVLAACAVDLGALDRRATRWLAAVADSEEIVMVLGWVERAYAAGQDALREEISDLDTRTTSLEAAAYMHALPPIDFPGRLAGRVPAPRCGAQEGRTALFAADVTCPACITSMALDQPAEACGRCAVPFDPTDTAFDGRARYGETLFCRGCVDQCHEADAGHRCIICIAGGAR